MKFSLATLLLVVLLAAIGCAALINVNDTWRQGMVTLAVTVLLISTLAAVVDRSRAFAIGFAVSGWVYLLLVFVPVFDLREDFLTTKVVQWAFTAIHDEVLHQPNQGTVAFTPDGQTLLTGSQIRLWNVQTGTLVKPKAQKVQLENFADTGHALWTIVVACLGGTVAIFLAATRRKPMVIADQQHPQPRE